MMNPFRMAPFKNHEQAAQIDHARLVQSMSELRPHLVGSIFGAVLVWFVFRGEASLYAKELWLLTHTLLAVFALICFVFYFRRPNCLSVCLWGDLNVFMVFVMGGAWALAPFAFLQTENPVYIVTLISILIGVCTSPSATMALYPLSYFLFITPILGSLTWHLNQLDFGQNLIVRLLVPIFWVFLLGYSINLHRLQLRLLRLQVEKDSALVTAENANASKSRFLASASHDIRQPLQAANLFLSVLENEVESDAGKVTYGRLQNALGSMSELLNSLLDISRLDSLSVAANKGDMALAPLLDRLAQTVEPQAKAKGLQFRLIGHAVFVRSDALLLERILSNLLSNAVRYTEQGSITLRAEQHGKRVQILVQDTGPGIPDDEHEAIFSEFYQLGNPERDSAKGLGLGLAIVSRLCALLGHKVEIRSAPGEGACFSVELEAGSAPVTLRQEALRDPWALPALQVLVVDDDSAIRAGMVALLTQWGLVVREAESLEEALGVVSSGWVPEVLLTDLRLRGHQSGLDVIQGLKEALGHEVPAILVTGDTDQTTLLPVREKVSMVLHKPVKAPQLRAALQRLVRHLSE